MIIIVIPILIAVLLGVEELLYRKYWDKISAFPCSLTRLR